jgi:hypothetical protein
VAPVHAAVWEHVGADKVETMVGYDALPAVLTIYCVHVHVIALAVLPALAYIQEAQVN